MLRLIALETLLYASLAVVIVLFLGRKALPVLMF